MLQFAIERHDGGGTGLVLVADGLFSFMKQFGRVLAAEVVVLIGKGIRLLTNSRRLPGGIKRRGDQTGHRVGVIANPGNVAPSVGRIRRMNADRIAMHAALKPLGVTFAFNVPTATRIMQDQLVRGQRDGFRDAFR